MATCIHCSCPLISSPYKSLSLQHPMGFLGTQLPKPLAKLEARASKFGGNQKKQPPLRPLALELDVGSCLWIPWAPNIDSQSIASQLFAASLFPYLVFLYYITKSKTAPKLTLVGFYFLLAFVGATIPAGIYAKAHYGSSLANVDWLHGGAESLLTITNLLIVLGLREGLRNIQDVKKDTPMAGSETKKQSSV